MVFPGGVVHPKSFPSHWLPVAFRLSGVIALDASWGGREAQDALAWLRRVHRPGGVLAVDERGRPLREGSHCVICGAVIDYALRRPHPESLSLQHVKPRSKFPELKRVRSNWAPSHLICNTSLGDEEDTTGGEFAWVYW
ncbi:MAG: HNH endonuclease [Propionibacteriaceae bacterium]|nr:HNH endonuclease [Propionibacteriaceae bacterium]